MVFFFFNETATTEIYTLSLHDALPISRRAAGDRPGCRACVHRRARHLANRRSRLSRGGSRVVPGRGERSDRDGDRSEEHTSELSHANISYAVFCLKKK